MVVLGAAALLGGCGDAASSASAIGELGNGTFEYRCIDVNDPVCRESLLATDFPDCLLVGGRFDVDYTLRDTDEIDDWDYEFLYVRTASENFIAGNDVFVAMRTGNAALLAYADETVVDILHLDLITPTTMSLEVVGDPSAPVDAIQIEEGRTVELRGLGGGSSATCSQPGGSIPLTAESSDSAIVSTSVVATAVLLGEAVGSATVTIRMGELSQTVNVEVTPASSTATDSDTDGSGTAGSSTTAADSGSGTDASSGSDASSSGGSDSGSSGGGSSGGGSGGSSGGSSTGGI